MDKMNQKIKIEFETTPNELFDIIRMLEYKRICSQFNPDIDKVDQFLQKFFRAAREKVYKEFPEWNKNSKKI